MTDFHDNIFYYYRGPGQPQQGHPDPQLENNTTKSLVNILQYCNPVVALKFLKWLGIETTAKVAVELQRKTIGKERIRRASQRLLLGIVALPEPSDNPIAGRLRGLGSGDGHPDAWLYGEDFAVLIESKVGDARLESNQMKCHLAKLEVGGKGKPKCQVRTWADVHQFFRGLSGLNDKDRWLVGQFTQYLEWKGMTDFSGFEEWMFEFLVREEKDAAEKKLIRRTMERFGEKVLRGGVQSLNRKFYEEPFVGKFNAGDDHFWVAFGPAGGPGVFGKKAHQTISLHDHGLEVFVNVEKQPAIKLLKKAIARDEAKFIKIVSHLPGPFSASVVQKEMRSPMRSDDYHVAMFEGGSCKPHDPGVYGLKNSKSSAFNSLVGLLEEIRLPYFFLSRRIGRKEVLNLSRGSGDALVQKVFSIMERFQPLVEFINGGGVPSPRK
jgi:hypothetical protein